MGVIARGTERRQHARALTTSEAAWIAAIPVVALGLPAIALLGPPLGHALLAPEGAQFWPEWASGVMPEPVEQGRYLVALVLPLLLGAVTVAIVRARWTTRAARSLVVAVQLALVALLVAAMAGQYGAFGSIVPPREVAPPTADLLPWPTIAAAALATGMTVLLLRRPAVQALVGRWMEETPARRAASAVVALLAIALWLLHAVETEGTIGVAHVQVRFHAYFTFDETYAVLNGRSPLVDFAAQYGSLWPYAFAGAMSIAGASFGTWVGLALTATGVGMAAIYATLRRAARSSTAGLLLFLPVLAASFVWLDGTRESRWTLANYFGTFPLRYAGPSILAWLVARHLDGIRPRRAWPLFLAAGLVTLNNVDAGVPALGATLAALLWGGGPLTRTRVRRLALEAGGGLLLGLVLVSLLTLARAGELPHLSLLVRYARLFGRAGFAMYPMPLLGLHLAIYVTYVAAIGLATVRALRADDGRVLTGMLAWTGVFGLGVGTYYVGRSTPDDLPAMLLPWSLALALLSIPAIGAIRDASRPRPIAAMACLLGFFALACSLVQTPTPWEQVDRLRRTTTPAFAEPPGQSTIADSVQPGESVAILNMLGHRIAADLDVTNVSPYSSGSAIVTKEQLLDVIDALRAAGGQKLFLDAADTIRGVREALAEAGFRLETREATELWVDAGSPSGRTGFQ